MVEIACQKEKQERKPNWIFMCTYLKIDLSMFQPYIYLPI